MHVASSRPLRKSRLGATLCLTMLAGLVPIAPGQAAEPYVLGVSDQLTIKVVQWKAADSTFEEWTALGGDYVIGADGRVNFPMIGPQEGAGMTSADLAAELGAALQQTLGLATTPTVSVEIAEYGPIYVSGDVATPGEYPFAPNLSVVKALALAGGERRSAEAAARPDREMLTTTGTLDVLEDEYHRLQVRLARLDAELAGQTQIAVPPALEGHPDLENLLAAERAILETQDRQVAAQSSSLSDQVDLLTAQIEAFEQKAASTQTQLATAREQLEKVTALSDDGLAVASRVASTQTNVADLEARLLDTQTAILQAQQDIAKANREQAHLTDQRLADLSLERQTVNGQISALALKIATQRGLVQEAALYSGAATPGNTAPQYSYTIMRDGQEIEADLTTPVMAGDVVVARLQFVTEEGTIQ
ncbi:polysaccharide biosynthesis/export family protein [Devosia sp. XJ19-1]|uniref:Polysaccharide biosynthesis/export family protein n=1 Tax=Devosia ureilytica TaxID=2952754 RepID=A0A9Q4FTH5_9HYPH|nr:polysaccharide biosynthesis/export family protein [Devosia ureilytica]MCP8884400.1 polysaccharide biosynthesis/export family protein [Devosia ureilytica]MCP8888008.1 polysaccharide biosynthesis/export family protein [Devosia ureilytica]